jgi:uncharacterized membrane protein
MALARRMVSIGGALLGILYPFLIFILWRRAGPPILFLYWPTVVSAVFLFSFGRTLWFPPPFVERLARLQKPQLSAAEVAYCRHVTQMWCCFFILNGGIALALALKGSLKAWTLYAGLVSYLLIGAVFSAEYLYRQRRFRS